LSAVIPGLDCFDAVRVAPLHNSRPDKEVSPRGDLRGVLCCWSQWTQREPAIYRCRPRLFEL